MDSKVIPIKNKRKQNLSRLMIVALVEASVKQTRGIPFGPIDIRGSFSSLINRGLVVRKEIVSKHHIQSVWHVTSEAMDILKEMGVDVAS